jgi:hypothetical protein
MGCFFIFARVVALMTELAPHGKVFILLNQSLIDQVSLVHLLRLHWRRRPCVFFSFTGLYRGRFKENFQDPFVRMANLAIILTGSDCL